MAEADKHVTVAEAARKLGVTTRCVVKYLHSGRLKGNKRGKTWLIEASSVQAANNRGEDRNGMFGTRSERKRNVPQDPEHRSEPKATPPPTFPYIHPRPHTRASLTPFTTSGHGIAFTRR